MLKFNIGQRCSTLKLDRLHSLNFVEIEGAFKCIFQGGKKILSSLMSLLNATKIIQISTCYCEHSFYQVILMSPTRTLFQLTTVANLMFKKLKDPSPRIKYFI